MCILGRYGTLEVSDDNGANWYRVGKVVDMAANFAIEEVDCTSHDSNGVRESHPSFNTLTITSSCNYDDLDPGQNIVFDAMVLGATPKFRYRPVTGTGRREIIGDGFSTANDLASPNEDKATYDISVKLNNFVVQRQ